jgi:hypothetical protein
MKPNKIYEIWEQWPHYPVVSFYKLEDAIQWLNANRAQFALPIITSHIL